MQVTEVVIFAPIGDGFQVFGIPTVGDANTGDLTLLYKLLTIHACYSFRVAFAIKRFAK